MATLQEIQNVIYSLCSDNAGRSMYEIATEVTGTLDKVKYGDFCQALDRVCSAVTIQGSRFYSLRVNYSHTEES